MSNLLHRLKQFIDYKGISVRAFEMIVGFSNGAFASQLKNNRTIGSDKIENILNTYPELNANWLFREEGEMLARSDVSVDVVREPSEYQNPRLQSALEELAEARKEIIALQKQLLKAGKRNAS